MALSVLPDLLELFVDTVTIEPWLSDDRYGKPTYGPAFDCPARVIGRTRVAIDGDGQERVSHVQAMLAGNFGATPQDKFTLPVRFSLRPAVPTDLVARQPEAVAVDKQTDENGGVYEVVYFSPTPRNRGF
jgi:hypothetical protein